MEEEERNFVAVILLSLFCTSLLSPFLHHLNLYILLSFLLLSFFSLSIPTSLYTLFALSLHSLSRSFDHLDLFFFFFICTLSIHIFLCILSVSFFDLSKSLFLNSVINSLSSLHLALSLLSLLLSLNSLTLSLHFVYTLSLSLFIFLSFSLSISDSPAAEGKIPRTNLWDFWSSFPQL